MNHFTVTGQQAAVLTLMAAAAVAQGDPEIQGPVVKLDARKIYADGINHGLEYLTATALTDLNLPTAKRITNTPIADFAVAYKPVKADDGTTKDFIANLTTRTDLLPFAALILELHHLGQGNPATMSVLNSNQTVSDADIQAKIKEPQHLANLHAVLTANPYLAEIWAAFCLGQGLNTEAERKNLLVGNRNFIQPSSTISRLQSVAMFQDSVRDLERLVNTACSKNDNNWHQRDVTEFNIKSAIVLAVGSRMASQCTTHAIPHSIITNAISLGVINLSPTYWQTGLPPSSEILRKIAEFAKVAHLANQAVFDSARAEAARGNIASLGTALETAKDFCCAQVRTTWAEIRRSGNVMSTSPDETALTSQVIGLTTQDMSTAIASLSAQLLVGPVRQAHKEFALAAPLPETLYTAPAGYKNLQQLWLSRATDWAKRRVDIPELTGLPLDLAQATVLAFMYQDPKSRFGLFAGAAGVNAQDAFDIGLFATSVKQLRDLNYLVDVSLLNDLRTRALAMQSEVSQLTTTGIINLLRTQQSEVNDLIREILSPGISTDENNQKPLLVPGALAINAAKLATKTPAPAADKPAGPSPLEQAVLDLNTQGSKLYLRLLKIEALHIAAQRILETFDQGSSDYQKLRNLVLRPRTPDKSGFVGTAEVMELVHSILASPHSAIDLAHAFNARQDGYAAQLSLAVLAADVGGSCEELLAVIKTCSAPHQAAPVMEAKPLETDETTRDKAPIEQARKQPVKDPEMPPIPKFN